MLAGRLIKHPVHLDRKFLEIWILSDGFSRVIWSLVIPIAIGGNEVNKKLYNMRYIWSIMTVPEKPQYIWYQKQTKTKA